MSTKVVDYMKYTGKQDRAIKFADYCVMGLTRTDPKLGKYLVTGRATGKEEARSPRAAPQVRPAFAMTAGKFRASSPKSILGVSD